VVRTEVLRKRLGKLDEYLAILQELRRYTFEEFVADPEHYRSVERFLQLAIETLTDLGNHVIADLRLGTVASYSDIPRLLHEAGYISVEIRENWIRMIGFRNVLVHDYLDVDRRREHVWKARAGKLGAPLNAPGVGQFEPDELRRSLATTFPRAIWRGRHACQCCVAVVQSRNLRQPAISTRLVGVQVPVSQEIELKYLRIEAQMGSTRQSRIRLCLNRKSL
jgi:uncharacterized protein YutE (UPF0331/DUF86 family)